MLSVDAAAFLLWAVLILTVPASWLLGVMVSVIVHELFHAAAIWATGGKIRGVHIGTAGIIMETEPYGNLVECFCAIAGPAGSFLLLCLYRAFPEAAICGFLQGFFNLIPVYPLDGGRALCCLLDELCPEYAGAVMGVVKWCFYGILLLFAVWCMFETSLGVFPLGMTVLLIIRSGFRKTPCKRIEIGVQ